MHYSKTDKIKETAVICVILSIMTIFSGCASDKKSGNEQTTSSVTEAQVNTTEAVEIYTRLTEPESSDLVPSGEYGTVFPYQGANEQFGFCSEKGGLLTDPCFNGDIEYYASFYIISKGTDVNKKYGLVNLGGNVYTGCIYSKVYYFGDKLYAIKGNGADKTLTVYSENIKVLSEESNFGIKDDFFGEDEVSAISGFPDYDRVIYNNRLYDTKTGDKLAEYPVIQTAVSSGDPLLLGYMDEEYFLLDDDGNEISDHYSDVAFDCPLFIASKDGLDHFDVISRSGDVIETIPTTNVSDIVGLGYYFMVKDQNGDYDIYDPQMRLFAENIKTNGGIYEYFDASGDPSRCPLIEGSENDQLINPSTGKTADIGERYIDIYRISDSIYVKTPEMIIQYSNDMEKLNETELGYIYGLKDEKTKKNYIVISKYEKGINEVREADSFKLLITVPFEENIKMIDNGICYVYCNKEDSNDIYTVIYTLTDRDDVRFRYKTAKASE